MPDTWLEAKMKNVGYLVTSGYVVVIIHNVGKLQKTSMKMAGFFFDFWSAYELMDGCSFRNAR